MGSAAVPVHDDAIHVGFDGEMWWAVGRQGSYGGSHKRIEAIKIARDASATAHHGTRRIVVHYRYGNVAYVITKVYQPPSPQFFQDSVE